MIRKNNLFEYLTSYCSVISSYFKSIMKTAIEENVQDYLFYCILWFKTLEPAWPPATKFWLFQIFDEIPI